MDYQMQGLITEITHGKQSYQLDVVPCYVYGWRYWNARIFPVSWPKSISSRTLKSVSIIISRSCHREESWRQLTRVTQLSLTDHPSDDVTVNGQWQTHREYKSIQRSHCDCFFADSLSFFPYFPVVPPQKLIVFMSKKNQKTSNPADTAQLMGSPCKENPEFIFIMDHYISTTV